MVRREQLLKSFGANVRRLRSAAGFSQEAFAAKARIDRSYMGAIERGERNPTLVNIARIAEALGVTPSHLVDGVRT